MTRAEATTVFYRLYDGEYPEFERRMSNGTFEDVKTDYWFYKEVETLYNIGIVDGTDEHKFSPDAPVTARSLPSWRRGSPIWTTRAAISLTTFPTAIGRTAISMQPQTLAG